MFVVFEPGMIAAFDGEQPSRKTFRGFAMKFEEIRLSLWALHGVIPQMVRPWTINILFSDFVLRLPAPEKTRQRHKGSEIAE